MTGGVDLAEIATGLRPGAEGIWTAAGRARVSYPEGQHADCIQLEEQSFWFRHRNACIAAMVRRHQPPAGPVLDLGGGNGYVSRRLLDDGWPVILVEPGETGAANARRRGLPDVACATLEQAGFRDGAIAAVGLFDVVEHVADDRALVAEVARVLQPGGMAYFTVPCHQWLWSNADLIAGHHRRHTLASMQALLAPGFQIAYASYFFRPLVVPQLLLRAAPYRLGFRGRRGALPTGTEHGGGGAGALADLLGLLLRPEVDRIAAGASLRFGASALVAARRR